MAIAEKLKNVMKGMLGTSNASNVKRYMPLVKAAGEFEKQFEDLDDAELRQRSADLKAQIKGEGDLDNLQAEAFSLVRVAADRRIGMWNAITDSKGEYKEAGAWGTQWSHVQGAREALADGKNMWDIDLPGSVYAHVREKYPESKPPFRMRAHDVQVIGAAVLHTGSVAEMKTGEGKTLVACLASYLNALYSKVHIITVNDYLAKRDAEWNAPVLRFLGVSVGFIQSEMDPSQRLTVYDKDVIYGTNNEFGFDYLRDNLKQTREDQVQKVHHYGIVDEVDSVLIDEARTPLIISGPASSTPENYVKANEVAKGLSEGEHYEVDIKDRNVKLTDEGQERAAELFGVSSMYDEESMHLPHFLDNALKAHCLYHRDKEYLVAGGQVKIVDEFTGRAMEGRRWSDGLHQAVEAKEGVNIQQESQTYATITLQNYFRMYRKLSGMTGTALTEAHEFNDIYKLSVVAIPTNKPVIRRDLPDLIYGSEDDKFNAIADGVAEIHALGQPVLVGTASVDVSGRLSKLFKRKGVKHNVLNARQHSKEADVVKRAGHLGAVTVATNMAGRGTDIVLGHATGKEVLKHWQRNGLAPKKAKVNGEDTNDMILDNWLNHYLDPEEAKTYEGMEAQQKLNAINKVLVDSGFHAMPMPGDVMGDGLDMRQLGGLRIVGTERHESRRIDNQLRGRSGRQGDPGASRFYLSLDDDLMKRFAPPFMRTAMQKMGLSDGQAIESKMVTRSVEKAQKKVEEVHYGMRKRLLEDDQVMNIQRKQIYEERQRILEGENLEEFFLDFSKQALDDMIQEAAGDGTRGIELADRIGSGFEELSGLSKPAADDIPVKLGGDACRDYLLERVTEATKKRRQELGDEVIEQIFRFVLLETIDHNWKDHLYAMDHLKHGIGLESYGQKDPRLRFKEEGFRLFIGAVSRIRRDALRMFFRIQVEQGNAEQGRQTQAGPTPAPAKSNEPVNPPADELNAPGAPKPGPDDPCPCGSGLPYKHCHGDFS